MKRTVAILLALCLSFALSGCASESDVEAAAAQRDAAQEKLNALQETYDVLQNGREQYSEYIQLMEGKEYDTVLEKLEGMQADKEKAAAEMIEPYLVTVELTTDNFADYFEVKSQTVAGNNGEDVPVFYLASKVYEQGLILYKSDAVIGVTYSRKFNDHTETVTNPSNLFRDRSLYSIGSPNDFYLVLGGAINRVEGTVTFVKEEAVTDYRVEDGDNGREYGHITLINGDQILHALHFGEKF